MPNMNLCGCCHCKLIFSIHTFLLDALYDNCLKRSKKTLAGCLGIFTDRDQRSQVFLNEPEKTLPLKENPKNTFRKAKL